MLYAFVSDIHSNLPAWKSVLADIASVKAGRIVSLGDVVGYGPSPVEVLESVYSRVDAFVMGNHDAVVAGKMSPESFNDHALGMVEWTQERVGGKGKAFLAKQPLVLSGRDFVCTHGSLDNPAAFNYVITPDEALECFARTDSPLVFVGHTHCPSICVLGQSGVPHIVPAQDFELEEGKRYLVNAGSVGDPRDGDPRASYCLYDDVSRTICFRRVAFDYSLLKDAVISASLDPASIPILNRDPLEGRKPLRETMGFAPPVRQAAMARDVIASAAVSGLVKANRRLKGLAAAAVVSAAGLLGLGTGIVAETASGHKTVRDRGAKTEIAVPGDVARSDLLAPFPAEARTLQRRELLAGWNYTLSNPRHQMLTLTSDGSLAVRNAKRSHLVLESASVNHNGHAAGKRVKIFLKTRKDEDFIGSCTVKAVLDRGKRTERVLVEARLQPRTDAMKETCRTMKKDAPRLSSARESVSLVIEGEFFGTVFFADPKIVFVD